MKDKARRSRTAKRRCAPTRTASACTQACAAKHTTGKESNNCAATSRARPSVTLGNFFSLTDAGERSEPHHSWVITSTDAVPSSAASYALAPRPRLHLTRFHGVLAPNAKLRAEVVPKPARDQAHVEEHT